MDLFVFITSPHRNEILEHSAVAGRELTVLSVSGVFGHAAKSASIFTVRIVLHREKQE
jgi:hypothetical protein